MKVDITEMTSFFDALDPYNDDEQKVYGFRAFCLDGVFLDFFISIYESKVTASIYKNPEVSMGSIHFHSCLEIKILDKKNKQLEIVRENKQEKCILSLCDHPILQYQE